MKARRRALAICAAIIAVVVMNGSNEARTEKDIQVFSWDGSALKEVGRLKVSGGSAAVRTAEK